MIVDMLSMLNFVSLKELLIFTPALPAILIAFIAAKIEYDKSKEGGIYIIIGALAFVIGTGCIGFAWRKAPAYGVTQAIISYIPFVVIVIENTDTRISELIKKIPEVIFSVIAVIALISIVIAVPLTVIPYYRQTPQPPQVELLSTTFLTDSLDQIGNSFQDVEKAIKSERGKIEISIQKLLSDFEKSKKDLEKVSEQQKQLKAEAEYYKQMASLTKAQARAVESMLRRSKYVDYFIGFLVGIASSVTAIILSKFKPQMLRKS